jgi:hypothetical protein
MVFGFRYDQSETIIKYFRMHFMLTRDEFLVKYASVLSISLKIVVFVYGRGEKEFLIPFHQICILKQP